MLTRIPNWPLWFLTLAFGTLLLIVTLAAEYVGLAPGAPGYALSRLLITASTYAIAFVLFTLIYSARERSVISATLTALVAAGLALDLLGPHIIGLRSAGILAIITGLLVGQATWALNYGNLSAWSAGVLLLALFYCIVGVAQQYYQDKMAPNVVVEFAVVLAVAVFAAWQLAPVR